MGAKARVKSRLKRWASQLSIQRLNLLLALGLVMGYLTSFFRKEDSSSSDDSLEADSAILVVNVSSGAAIVDPSPAFSQSNLAEIMANLPVDAQFNTLDLESVYSKHALNFYPFSYESFDPQLLAADPNLADYWAIENYQVYTLGYVAEIPAGICYPEEEKALWVWDVSGLYALVGLGVLFGAYQWHSHRDAELAPVVDSEADINLVAPVVTVTEDANNDGVITAAELEGDIDVQVSIPAGALVGDKLIVSDGTTEREIVLDAEGSITTSFTSPGEGETITVTARLEDSLGNVSDEGEDSAVIDTLAGDTGAAPVVTITEDANDDGVISASELEGDIDVQVSIPAGAVVGDKLIVRSEKLF